MRKPRHRRAAILLLAAAAGACSTAEAISPERAVIERAAIHHDLRNDSPTLFAIAVKRAKMTDAALADKKVTCALSNIDIRFVNERRAVYTASYACGVVPWELGKTAPVATPTIKLELWKEGGPWMINSFLR